MKHDEEAVKEMLNELDQFIFKDLPAFLIVFGQTVVLPAIKYLAVLFLSFKVLMVTQRRIFPPSNAERHREILELYKSGSVKEAIKAWSSHDLDSYGPSYMSRACHELYVKNEAVKAVTILKEAEERKVPIDEKQVKQIKSDVLAVLNGNSIMIKTNATLAKEQHLGVTEW